MIPLLKMAFRNLGRNRRRSLLSALAVSMGVGLLLLMASVISGEMRDTLQNSMKLHSGHLQIRAATYDEEKVSLAWDDLVENPEQIIAQLKSLPQVKDATPRLFASGIVAAGEESKGVQVYGIDPDSPANQPFREGVVVGEFLRADDREGILIGKPLATKLKLQVGDQVSLLINTANGEVDEQLFTIRGIYSTGTSAFDEGTVFMPLSKAQAFTGTQNHASTIFVLLHDYQQAEAVAAAVQSSSYQVLTWQKMNELIVQTEDFANAYMVVIYLIVLGITATVVTNTLVMAVFERTREIGILSAIGMKGRQILALFLTEGGLIATGGVIAGLPLGVLMVALFNWKGFYIGNMGITGLLMSDTIYAYLEWQDAINLSIAAYIVTLIASLYPAVIAARMEPVEALHAQ